MGDAEVERPAQDRPLRSSSGRSAPKLFQRPSEILGIRKPAVPDAGVLTSCHSGRRLRNRAWLALLVDGTKLVGDDLLRIEPRRLHTGAHQHTARKRDPVVACDSLLRDRLPPPRRRDETGGRGTDQRPA